MICNIFSKILFITILVSSTGIFAQVPYSDTNFRSPIQIPIVLAGTFGELRPNHFHAGIDLKTKGLEGLPIIAIADGFVSRVKISTGGYGKALYLTHDNGYTSVYAHLSAYEPGLADYVLDEQYRHKTYTIQFFPETDQYRYQKGDTIAWSGNSGSSTAPHLHFEIRDTKTQQAINPLLFGFNVKDTTPPILRNLHVYPLGTYSSINGKDDTLRLPIKKIDTRNYGLESDNFKVKGKIGFGIDTYDLLDNALNKNGVYSIELHVDSVLIYKHKMERFAFSESRYINSLMDYHAKKKYFLKPQKSFLDPHNNLSVYEFIKDDGSIYFDTSANHKGEYVVKDVDGNSSRLRFSFSSDSSLFIDESETLNNCLAYNEDHSVLQGNLNLLIRENSLYNNIDFKYQRLDKLPDFLTDIHCIHKPETPLHKSIQMSLLMDSISDSIKDKALVCKIDDKGDVSCLESHWQGDTIRANLKSFGNFSVIVDTIPPTLKTESYTYDLSTAKYMSFIVKDELSGVDEYNAYVDGQWILLEYDPKQHLLTHYFDGRITSGLHNLELIVKDNVKNTKQLKLKFVR